MDLNGIMTSQMEKRKALKLGHLGIFGRPAIS
jgi:hypothetical protein